MAKRNNKSKRRVKNLALICTIAAILLVTSTYAWFIGMRTVKVNDFDVEIAAVDGLTLSLDGSTWTESLNVTSAPVYTGNTNMWAEEGLIPMSSVGVIDTTSSTLQMYEKASLTATTGGYRLLASRVNNYTANADSKYPEQGGYVAFDLFIKNLSGSEYYAGAYNEKNEEAIYLTNDSKVSVATTGVDGTGIENSVRVAFAQIGRVIATTTNKNQITGISCTSEVVPEGQDPKKYATGICRTATIWEPNDRAHTTDAIKHYDNSCRTRDDDTAEYGDADDKCAALVDGLPKTTYAISDVIDYKDEDGDLLPVVDIYDGADYNGYTQSTVLNGFDTFTDSEKLLTGTARPTFFTLAPNSITKVRVYIYIEGQDIDNYDLAQIGKKISVSFGFTKQRYNEDDFGYTGPVTNEGYGPFVWDATANDGEGAYVEATDETKPFIKLAGDNVVKDTVTLEEGTEFLLSSVTATAYDKKTTFTKTTVEGKDVYTVATETEKALAADTGTGVGVIKTSGTVNTGVPGTYQVVYSVKDAAGNIGTKVLNVVVTEKAVAGE